MKQRRYRILFASLLTLAFICSIITPASTAQAVTNEVDNTVQVIPLEDGSIMVIEIEQQESSTYSVRTVESTKTAKDISEDGVLNWKFVLKATFRFDLIAATCLSCDTSYSVSRDDWRFSNITCSKSGNSASASCTVKKYVLGVNMRTRNVDLKITCTPEGKIS